MLVPYTIGLTTPLFGQGPSYIVGEQGIEIISCANNVSHVDHNEVQILAIQQKAFSVL